MKKLKALVTATFSEEGLTRLSEYMDVEYHDWFKERKGPFSPEDLIKMATGKDVLIVEISPVPKEVLEACPTIKLIG